MKNTIILIFSFNLIIIGVKSQTLSKETILLETNYGVMKLKLYDETPLHKANFLKLVNQTFFDSL
jgi:hypothetical protein